MARLADIKIEEVNGGIRVLGIIPGKVERLLRDTIDDIADEVEETAKDFAPVDKDPDTKSTPGALQEHPVDRLSGESFLRERGPGGRFTSGPGNTVAYEEISVAREPYYAIWVHDGTGIFGPRGQMITPVSQPFMVYKSFGKWHRRTTVAGQHPQPYLTKAYAVVRNTYVPIRIEELRARLQLAT